MPLDPIAPEWTIAELLEWLGDDSRQNDESLRHPLTLIEAALTGAPWRTAPSTVALIRSIADAARMSPSLRAIRISSLAQRRRSGPSPLAPEARLGGVPGRGSRVTQRTERSAQPA